MQNKTGEYQLKLKVDFPELLVENLKIIGKGWHHDAIEVNNTIIFRIPRGDHQSDITSTSVHYETAALKLLQGKLPVEIPNPLYIANDFSYFGYPKLPGILLAEVWDALSDNDKNRSIEDWVNIIISIYDSISLEEAHTLKIPLFIAPGSDVSETAKKIYAIDGLESYIYEFSKNVLAELSQIDIENEQQAVIHNDLHFFNLLVDSAKHKLIGVIDWTDICIGPIAREFSVWEWQHDNSLEKSIAVYTSKTGRTMDIQQARLWKHLETISDLVEATEVGDTKKVNESIEHIRQWSSIEH